MLVHAEAEIPAAIAAAFRAGQLRASRLPRHFGERLVERGERASRTVLVPALLPDARSIAAWETEGGAGG